MIANVFVYGRCETRDYRWILPPTIPLAKSFCARILEYNGRRLSSGDLLFLKSQTMAGTFPYFLLSFQSSQMDERGRKIQFIIGFEISQNDSARFDKIFPKVISNLNVIVSSFNDFLAKCIKMRTQPEQNVKYDFEKNVLIFSSHVTLQDRFPSSHARSMSQKVEISTFMDKCLLSPMKMGNFDFRNCGNEYNSNFENIQEEEIKRLNAYHAEILPVGISAAWRGGYFFTNVKNSESEQTVRVHGFESDDREHKSDEDKAWEIYHEKFEQTEFSVRPEAIIPDRKPQQPDLEKPTTADRFFDESTVKPTGENRSRGGFFGLGKKRKGD